MSWLTRFALTLVRALSDATLPIARRAILPTRQGRVQTVQNFRDRVFVPLQQTCGMTTDGKSTSKGKYGFHALRHAAASLFIAHLGWTPKRVQTVMGHAKISMTYDLYGHLFDDPEADRRP